MYGSPNLNKMGQYDPKATNPKDAIAGSKLPLDLVPDTGIAYAALAFLEGALKYGKFNWRIAGVRWSVYEAALKRHLTKVKEGEWEDPVTGVPHLASAIACLFIVADAYENDMLIDDRPPSMKDASKFIDSMPNKIAHLKEVFKSHNPHQWTIKDNEQRPGEQTNQGNPQPIEIRPTLGEDAQSIPRWDGGRLVLGTDLRYVDRVQVAGGDPIQESEGRTYVFGTAADMAKGTDKGRS